MAISTIRTPAVAGSFYPGDPIPLRALIDRLLSAAEVEPAPERVAAIVVPHAGYRYSGATAAHAYKRVAGKNARRVILIGCSHHYRIDRCSVITKGAFATPIGDLPIDESFAADVVSVFGSSVAEAHVPEHSLEVQLPFLAAVLPGVSIVPVLFGSPISSWHTLMGERLATMTEPGDLVVISTDLSHFLDEPAANRIDHHSIQAVLDQDWATFARGIEDGSCSMCGATAVVAGMAYAKAKGATDWRLLDYRTSAAASGDRSRVVGYAAISMEHAA